jgi:hypothetical protein
MSNTNRRVAESYPAWMAGRHELIALTHTRKENEK